MKTKTTNLFYIIAGITGMIIILYVGNSAVVKSINNQDTMLCESAKISGNEEYLEKCKCYYETENIGCLQL